MEFYTSCERRFDQILLRGYRDNQQFQEKIKYNPTIYLPSNNSSSPYKSIDNKILEPFQAGSMKETVQFIKKYDDVSNFDYYGMDKFEYSFLQEKYPNDIDYNSNLIRIGIMDIEVESENGFPDIDKAEEVLNLITLYFNKKYYVFGLGEYANNREDVVYLKFSNEERMLLKFIEFWQMIKLDIISGWYVEGFDIVYLVNRIKKILGVEQAKKLSPWGLIDERQVEYANSARTVIDIVGIATLDYLDIYKKFSYKFPDNYKLDTIAHNELGFGKIDHSEYDTLRQLYKNDWQKFVQYNIRDTEIVVKLEAKIKLLELILNLAYTAKVNFIDTFKQTVMWDCIIYDYLKNKNIIIPRRPKSKKEQSFAGAYVMEPVPGMYEWVVSFDLDSLYPHLIMQYSIGPDTFVKKTNLVFDHLVSGISQSAIIDAKENNLSLAANGTMYRRDRKSFLSELMNKMYDERKEYKNKMIELENRMEKEGKNPDLVNEHAKYSVLQLVKKVCLNSAYGAVGNPGFRFFNPDYAEAITLSGQLSTQWIERKLNEYLNQLFETINEKYVIYADTDSVYVCFDKLRKKVGDRLTDDQFISFLDKYIDNKISPFIDNSYQELAEYMNAYEQKMHMKREKICDKVLLSARKKYIVSAWDSEKTRYKEAKIKVTGIEAIRSSTPEICREGLKDAFKVIMQGTESDMHEYIRKFKEKFLAASFEETCFPRGVNGMIKYGDAKEVYSKGTPIHTRAALMYNYLIDKHNLELKYEKIQEGEKIKFGYLKTPNIINENVIAFINFIPQEFELEEYYDYDMQFEKAFIVPLQNVLNIIGWKTQKEMTLEDFFG